MSECQTVCVSSEGDVCFAVIDAVSELTATDPLELEPLGAVVDTDAVETLFDSAPSGTVRHDASLSFRYENCDVTVGSDGTVSATRAATTATFESEYPAASAVDVGSAAGGRGDADVR
ncbi:HalOD1 output domain-containing protein [Halogeometricum luteum]|uniref:HalOD1 output domain-containing protein n=1 Tax=Halogeometricum luteum TaxID=2950537 RepID=UPI00287BAC6A|nr:HalOD1 output domain-containing protein [Halogeometricum sp. S3BR5-2]